MKKDPFSVVMPKPAAPVDIKTPNTIIATNSCARKVIHFSPNRYQEMDMGILSLVIQNIHIAL